MSKIDKLKKENDDLRAQIDAMLTDGVRAAKSVDPSPIRDERDALDKEAFIANDLRKALSRMVPYANSDQSLARLVGVRFDELRPSAYRHLSDSLWPWMRTQEAPGYAYEIPQGMLRRYTAAANAQEPRPVRTEETEQLAYWAGEQWQQAMAVPNMTVPAPPTAPNPAYGRPMMFIDQAAPVRRGVMDAFDEQVMFAYREAHPTT